MRGGVVALAGELIGGHPPGEEACGFGRVGSEAALVEFIDPDPLPAEEGLERWEVKHGDYSRDRPWVLEEDRDPVVNGEGEHLG